jgi:SAM-dependent methyltransferase
LSVACGYGTETFSCYERFKPKQIFGVDVTQKHVSYSADKARQLMIDDDVHFNHGNACALDFPARSFSHIIGIEGPVHFDTRRSFFSEAQRVLQKKGELILTDIILGSKLKTISGFHRAILHFTAKHWIVPDANWVDDSQYKRQLRNAGFTSVYLEKIGGMVFPGYARNAFVFSTIKNRLLQRGVFATIGLTIISYLLGYLYKRKIIEYIFVKAQA